MAVTESESPVFAFLGPRGTYSDEAVRLFASRMGISDPVTLPCASFDEVFDCIDRGKCEFGVVAKENSLEGSVTATLDNFSFKSSATILGEEVLDIHHCLLMAPGASIEQVEKVASHSQGIAQCRRFLAERLPGRSTITTASTADSARLAAADPSVAAIANAFAADLYGVRVEATQIEDHLGNKTIFNLIARQGHPQVFPSGVMKTSAALFMHENRPGTLNMILSEFAYAGIDLSMIQSRPTKQSLGDYMFFVEFMGTALDPSIQQALNCLRLKLREVKVVGSYPVLGGGA